MGGAGSKIEMLAEEQVADRSTHGSAHNFFKLTVDCCDEIFDYLSLKDLHSFGLTCKGMQRVTGEYFKRNFKQCEKFTNDDGIYTVYSDHQGVINQRTHTSGFNQYIYNISYYYETKEPLRYIQSHSSEFDSIGSIYLVCTHIDKQKMKYFLKLLPKVENVTLHQCTMYKNDIYEIMLKFCENMKSLIILDDLNIINNHINRSWFDKIFAQLEHITLDPRYTDKLDQLSTFLERNPNIQSFSTSASFLWANNEQLLSSNVKLTTFDVDFTKNISHIDMQKMHHILNELREKGFYKHLHLTVPHLDQQFCERIFSLRGIEKLVLSKFTEIYQLNRLTSLKKLSLPSGLKANDIDILATSLVNLEMVSINSISSNDLLPFMRCSMKLKQLYAYLNDGCILNLIKLNREREQLIGARRVIIYLQGNIFLATKWKIHNGDASLKLVEMRRCSHQ